jgi:hypothetical protein
VTHPLLQQLEGGDLRSIGRSEIVVDEVLQNPSLFGIVFDGMSAADARIRMRCADAVEKITARRPDLLVPYKTQLLAENARSDQQEVRWHVAQMIPRLALDPQEREQAVQVLLGYLGEGERSKIVKTFAMQALADLAIQDQALLPRIIPVLEKCARTGSPAMQSRGRKLLKALADLGG